MIATDYRLQMMCCTVCGDVDEIPRRLLRDPEALLVRADELARDHRECAANPNNPKQASLDRAFRKRVEREFARAKAKEIAASGRRCTGRSY